MAAVSGYTWDGLPIAPDEPHGAAILVRRPGEYLILHRAHRGPGYDGDWAWTPPSGSRLPDEPVLAAALRELAEETGLHVGAAELRALDLSGRWAHFLLDVPASAQPRLDHEHDRFEWLRPDAAIGRCKPAAVADGIRLAESSITAEMAFLPLDAAEQKSLPLIAGDGEGSIHIAVVGGRDAGFFQHYQVTGGSALAVGLPDTVGIDYAIGQAELTARGLWPQLIWSYVRDVGLLRHCRVTADEALAVGLPDTVGIDYAIGQAELAGRGLGPQLVWSYLRDVVLPSHPGARHVVASPDATDVGSIRVLQQAGFAATREITVSETPGPQRLCVLDVAKFFGLEG